MRLLEAAGGDARRPTASRRRHRAARPDAARDAVRRRAAGVGGARPGPRARVARTRGFVRVIGKGDRSAWCRSATSRSTGWAGTSPGRAARWLAARRAAATGRAARCSSRRAGARLGRQQAWPVVKAAAEARGPRRPGLAAHAAPLVRDPPARGRRRPAGRPGAARTCQYLHDPAVHPPDGRADPRGLRAGPPARLRRTRAHELRRLAARVGRAGRPPRAPALVRSSSASTRCAILALDRRGAAHPVRPSDWSGVDGRCCGSCSACSRSSCSCSASLVVRCGASSATGTRST